MKANELTLQDLLIAPNQFVIPLFQRYYVWERANWQRLWDDLNGLLEADAPKEHFMGSLVCLSGSHEPGKVPQYMVIDGQQRLMTFGILLSVLRDEARKQGKDDLAQEIQEGYLVHKFKHGLERYKILPRLRDRQTLLSLIEGDVPDGDGRVGQAYDFFRRQMATVQTSGDDAVRTLLTALGARFALVMITLKDENPFVIFETLNSAGQKLDQSDLIRNHVFMQVPLDDQDTFDEKHWRPLENSFDSVNGAAAIPLTDFYRDFLMRNGDYVRQATVYMAFKEKTDKLQMSPPDFATLLKRYGRHYLWIHRPFSVTGHAKVAFELDRLRRLSVSTSYPLVLHLLELHEQESITDDDLARCLRAIASFVIRRSIVRETTRPYSRWFPAAIKELQKEDAVGSLAAFFEKRGWPGDDIFADTLVTFHLYRREPGIARVVLMGLEQERHHKEVVDVAHLLDTGKLELEHVMPQTIGDEPNGDAWKEMLGEEWQQVQDTWLHTLGNLTLTGYNPPLSNRPFSEKRELFKDSNLGLTRDFEDYKVWNAETIKDRGKKLAQQVAQIWPGVQGYK